MNTVAASDSPLVKVLKGFSKQALQDELSEVERQIAALNTHRELVQLILRWKDASNGGTVASERPTLRKALRFIMAERPGKWRKRELMEQLDQRGWLPGGQQPDRQITNRLSDMVETGEVIRHEPGVFSLSSTNLRGAPPSGGGEA